MINDLRLQQFRSYRDSSFELSPGVNIIVGPNASGKTNLLEAVLVVARGHSYRTKDADLVRFEQPWTRLDAHLGNGSQRTVKIVSEPKPEKVYELDDRVYRRLTLPNTLPVVLFEPNHLQLLSSGPERRREYLDDLLEQSLPGYGTIRRQYRRTLVQRNSLLKQAGPGVVTQLFPWNVRLSQLAGQIVRARHQLTERLCREIGPLYTSLSGVKTVVELLYGAKWPPEQYESHLLNKLESDIDLDRMRGFTGAGPHREDLAVLFNQHPAAEVASRGEARTAVLALKIIELQVLKESREEAPILLLDDVFSELDGRRRHALTDQLSDYQTFITTTEADIVVKHFTETCNIIPLTVDM